MMIVYIYKTSSFSGPFSPQMKFILVVFERKIYGKIYMEWNIWIYIYIYRIQYMEKSQQIQRVRWVNALT